MRHGRWYSMRKVDSGPTTPPPASVFSLVIKPTAILFYAPSGAGKLSAQAQSSPTGGTMDPQMRMDDPQTREAVLNLVNQVKELMREGMSMTDAAHEVVVRLNAKVSSQDSNASHTARHAFATDQRLPISPHPPVPPPPTTRTLVDGNG